MAQKKHVVRKGNTPKSPAKKKQIIQKSSRPQSRRVPNTPQTKRKALSLSFPSVSVSPMPKVGETAPPIVLQDQFGAMESLEKQRGKWVLVYFYPKDDTPGCTKEACMIRDGFPFFEKLDITVFGISVDSVASHKKFAQKYNLPFTLLSDENREIVARYGVWGKKKFMGREFMGTLRTSFLIDPNGVVARVYEGVEPAIHAEQVLSDVEALWKAR